MVGFHHLWFVAMVLLYTIAISEATPFRAGYHSPFFNPKHHSQYGCLCVKCTNWGSWEAWQPCTGPHSSLIQNRIRYCAEDTCSSCPAHDRIQNQIRKCQVALETCSPFSIWTDCSVACGGAGTKRREAVCVTPNEEPTVPSVATTKQETATCNMGQCPEFKLVQTDETCLTAAINTDAEAPFVFNLESGKYRLKLTYASGDGVTCRSGGTLWPFGCTPTAINMLLVSENAPNKRGPILVDRIQFDQNDGSGLDTTYIQTSDYFEFEKGKTYNIWYIEAYNQGSTGDNSGQTCVRVLAQEFPHPIRPYHVKPYPYHNRY